MIVAVLGHDNYEHYSLTWPGLSEKNRSIHSNKLQ